MDVKLSSNPKNKIIWRDLGPYMYSTVGYFWKGATIRTFTVIHLRVIVWKHIYAFIQNTEHFDQVFKINPMKKDLSGFFLWLIEQSCKEIY